MALNVLGLFSGIGGFELGFERAGFSIAAMCEIEPYCRAVLKKQWPSVPIYEDVCALTGERLCLDGLVIDVITGGFPCQDISLAGKGAGLGGARSGLWQEYRRVISEVRPRWVVIENVAALRSRGLDTVLREIAALGYDAEWHCIPASAVGAPHRRDRVWVIAYANSQRQHDGTFDAEVGGASESAPYTIGGQLREQSRRGSRQDGTSAALAAIDGKERFVADAHYSRLERWLRAELQECADQWVARTSSPFSDSAGERDDNGRRIEFSGSSGSEGRSGAWLSEPDVGRVAHGVPKRVDRLRALGNAVVPQIPEMIGRAIRVFEGLQP